MCHNNVRTDTNTRVRAYVSEWRMSSCHMMTPMRISGRSKRAVAEIVQCGRDKSGSFSNWENHAPCGRGARGRFNQHAVHRRSRLCVRIVKLKHPLKHARLPLSDRLIPPAFINRAIYRISTTSTSAVELAACFFRTDGLTWRKEAEISIKLEASSFRFQTNHENFKQYINTSFTQGLLLTTTASEVKSQKA